MSPYPKWVQGGFGKEGFGQKAHIPFGTKGTHFGEYRTGTNFGGSKTPQKEHSFGNTGKGLRELLSQTASSQSILQN